MSPAGCLAHIQQDLSGNPAFYLSTENDCPEHKRPSDKKEVRLIANSLNTNAQDCRLGESTSQRISI